MRRLAECAPELTAEVGAGEPGGPGQVADVKPLEVASVGKVLGAQEVPGGWNEGHFSASIAIARHSGDVNAVAFSV